MIDAIDRQLILATQAGLPLDAEPYHRVAESVGLTPQEVMNRLVRMREAGIIRRLGVVPNHYRLGYTANGMSVWDVPDQRVDELGEAIGRLSFVSHCYQRPRHLPDWPYNLFAMVHGRSREDVLAQVDELKQLLGDACRAHQVLFSTGILKKSGLRLRAEGG